MKSMSNFEKTNVMKAYMLLKDFIHDFEGGANDEENLGKLNFNLSKLKIAISKQNYEKIENFVESEIFPMVYEFDTVFEKSNCIGRIENGTRHIDTESELRTMCVYFIETLIEKEDTLEKFMMNEFHSQLIQ